MQPIILDKEFKRLCVIDDYISFIWTTRYHTTGDFELCIDVSNDKSTYIKRDFYVAREDDDNVGIIESVSIEMNEDGHEILIISGRFLSSILGRRIISQQTSFSNKTIANVMTTLITNEVVSPSIEERKIDGFILGEMNGDDKITVQYTGQNLLETIETLCETYGLGHKTILNGDQFEFILYKAEDKSYDQSVNSYVVFSDEYDNLLSSEYFEDSKQLITDVLVAGEGEGLNRISEWAGNGTGLDRYELYLDRRDLSRNDGEINLEDYYDQLIEIGLENITNTITSFTGQVYFDNIEYKKDVFVGDICSIENTNWGIYINSRLVEVIESVDETGNYSIIPTFAV